MKKLYTIIHHNVTVFFVMFTMEFYQFFDKIELQIYMWRKKGSVGDYHIGKLLKKKNVVEGPFHGFYKHIFVSHILLKLLTNKELIQYYTSYFHSVSLMTYTTQYNLIMDLKKCNSAETPKEVMDCIVYLNICNHRTLSSVLGKEQYDYLTTCTIEEACKPLQKDSE